MWSFSTSTTSPSTTSTSVEEPFWDPFQLGNLAKTTSVKDTAFFQSMSLNSTLKATESQHICTSDLIQQSWLESIDHFLLFNFFPTAPIWDLTQETKQPQIPLLVKVDATTVPPDRIPSLKRRSKYMDTQTPLEGSFIGRVHKSNEKNSDIAIQNGTRVTSLYKCRCRSRFVTIPSDKLIVVPENLDASEAALTVSTYLPAFAALHHGSNIKSQRRSPFALKGKKVFVTGGDRLEAKALVQLALWGGASKVYVLKDNNAKKNTTYRGKRVLQLGSNPEEWYPLLQGKMDLVVDYDFPRNFDAVRCTLKRKGRLVCHSPNKGSRWTADIENLCEQIKLSFIKRASLFDFQNLCENNPHEIEKDLQFLFCLLSKRQIRPQIDKYIRQQDIIPINRDKELRDHSGAIICEPWRF